jgi:hypothetical protein
MAVKWGVAHINNPSVAVFLPPAGKATGAAVVIIPGGGHRFLNINSEGYALGRWLASKGVAGFVVKYRLAKDQTVEHSPYRIDVEEMQDARRALRLVRSRAAEWGVDPARVGVLGFSAGGHLAAHLSMEYDDGNAASPDPVERAGSKPAFQALVYPGEPEEIHPTKDSPPAFLVAGIAGRPRRRPDQVQPPLQEGGRAGGAPRLHGGRPRFQFQDGRQPARGLVGRALLRLDRLYGLPLAEEAALTGPGPVPRATPGSLGDGPAATILGMSLVFLSLAIAGLWINLMGAGLAARRFIGDYAIARAASVLAICLVCFCLEYFVGWGPHLPLLPLTTALSLWLIWRNRALVRENWSVEALFGLGFFYCLLWRYTFPDVDFSEDKMPNYALIVAYMRGTRLPPPDLWMSPYRANFYYSFQHYGAGLMGRLLGVGPGVSYHLAFCTLVGFMTLLMGSCIGRLCGWPVGRWVVHALPLIGGSGVVAFVHILVNEPYSLDIVRFLGGSIVHNSLTPLGHAVSGMMTTQGVVPRDLPMEPLSYFLTKGDFHPPLSGFLLLAFAAALIAVLETGPAGARKAGVPRAPRRHGPRGVHLERLDRPAPVPPRRGMVRLLRAPPRHGVPAPRPGRRGPRDRAGISLPAAVHTAVDRQQRLDRPHRLGRPHAVARLAAHVLAGRGDPGPRPLQPRQAPLRALPRRPLDRRRSSRRNSSTTTTSTGPHMRGSTRPSSGGSGSTRASSSRREP